VVALPALLDELLLHSGVSFWIFGFNSSRLLVNLHSWQMTSCPLPGTAILYTTSPLTNS
jgi:hypothetical protein